ncbi:Ltp family lipoprotein [Bombilactobacillus folatiphilus]|uniref:Ltp family lipoprotein n=1 Tax=Bombilactobacillus folatiphilus TaxID=2923362 RepID=A0ABY4P772_9LACO|nr:Ltp family lipoprotein [Bombilactobacillus folatiphilus]UQS81558.1 Ltp family lipoprotein [Bombilactobacillus folatiphilus]
MYKQGIYDQLISEYGNKFLPQATQYATDNLQTDYNANALASAKNYEQVEHLSTEEIRDQLTSQYGEKFSPDEANYAVQHSND